MQSRQHERSKADYFPKYLFLRILCHTLQDSNSREDSSSCGSKEGAEEEQLLPTGGSSSTFPKVLRYLSSQIRPRTREPVPNPLASQIGLSRTLSFNAHLKVGVLVVSISVRSFHMAQTRTDMRNRKIVQQLLEGQRVNVRVAPMNILLFRDGQYESNPDIFIDSHGLVLGTVISIQGDQGLARTSPITDRLQHVSSGLRASPDASLLVQSLIDLGKIYHS